MLLFPLVVVCLFRPTPTGSVSTQIELERLEQIGGSHLLDASGTRVRKYNRTVSVLDGTFSILKDLDDSLEFTVTAARSALGNNQFNEYPMKVPRKKGCQIFQQEYAEYQHVWANYTSLPKVVKGEQAFCPLPKGDYWVKNFAPDASWVPPVVPEGYWRMTLEIYGSSGELEGQVRGFFRVKKSLT
ncbi:conserved hypothetical protein [Culex quinquefasciatus]|uniref:Uncharacterized protein n=1 Tax=Culex quinquefasciatus TaxID=7176 RepID=B0W6H8_CULQU|nr:uncharacterized protein LOC6033923 [Culex quinquefasciatus]EDS36652.1 conserved hypothetical protein [Culex quinquefasciatus]|eukprot:XP_001844312.1 conserved hypothetical protein [Culex quinquefasciatus]